MRRVGIYMRVSTERQVQLGQSLEAQKKLLMDHIKAHPDMVLVDEYMDDGVSGAKYEQRDELQRLLNDVKEGKIDLILFTRLDRFFRSVRHLMNTFDFLEKHHCEWEAIQEHHDSSSPSGKLALTIMGAFAQMESDMDSARTRDAFRHKRMLRQWLNGRPPYGFKLINKKAVADPEEAEIVRRMYSDYAKHGKLSRIIRDYIEYDCPHSRDSTRKILTNRVYIGEKFGIPDYTEAIVDKDLFDEVQRLISMNVKASQKNTHIFSGLVICPRCGKKMGANTLAHRWTQYRCNYQSLGRCDYVHTHSEMKIEEHLINTYKDELEQRYLHLKGVKKKDNSQRINTLYRKMDRLKDLYVNELIDLETYKRDLEAYRTEISELERPQETNTKQIEELLKLNVYDIYWTLPKEAKRRLWRSVVKSITPKDGSFYVEYL